MIKIHNTLTKKKEELQVDSNKVRMFVCGPTTYDYMHIGNARTFVAFDMIVKWLRYNEYDVEYIQNITDIDDKIITRANENKKDISSYSQEFEDIFYEDAKKLGITSPEYKKATNHIPEVIKQVNVLIEKGNAYLIDNEGYYFDLTTFPDYGKLSGREEETRDDGISRIDENDKKRNKGDFCLWKFSKDGEPSWKAPFGDGRPGWHIEDTAITEKYFGPQYDIHGGGIDLIFPHHEAEITQMESISGLKPFVKTWMHTGFIVTKGDKMSKSRGNFMTVRNALEIYSPEALRFYFLSSQYRAPLDYNEDSLRSAEAGSQRLAEFVDKLDQFEDEMQKEENMPITIMIGKAQEEFNEAMDDDFNTPRAFGVLFDLIKSLNHLITTRTMDQINARDLKDWMKDINFILGIVPNKTADIPEEISSLIQQREQARETKDYSKSDKLRDQIKSHGFSIDDTPYGPLVKMAK